MENWESLFDFDLTFPTVADDDEDFIIPPPPPANPNPPPLSSVEDIEQFLLKDDEDGFVDDILLDSPLLSLEEEEQGDKSVGEVVDHSDSTTDAAATAVEENDHDPLAKKRKRQLRNRDAALRSRERKKMHVKDLELKSRYYEGECRRLGSLLQWYMAENQALRFSLHSTTSNASITKQESAVLFLESLLLGSLLWLMGMVAVLPSHLLLLHHQSQSPLVEEKHLPSLLLVLRKEEEGIKTPSLGKRFKASRSRMRPFIQLFLILPVF